MVKPRGKEPAKTPAPSALLSYLEKNRDIFISSVKGFTWRLPLAMALDFLFYFIAFIGISTAAQKLRGKYEQILFPQSLDGLTPDQAALLLSQAKSFYYSLIGGIVIAVICLIVLWSLLKGIIWALTLRQKITPIYLWKFFLLNCAWLTFWISLLGTLAYISNLAQAKYVVLGLFAFFVILSNGLYTVFVPNPSFASVKKGLGFTLRNLHLLIAPYTLLFVFYILITKLYSFDPGKS